MEKKREARKRRDMEQRYVMQRAEMEKRKKLEVLQAQDSNNINVNLYSCSHLMRVVDMHSRITYERLK